MSIRAYKVHALWVDEFTGVAIVHRSYKQADNETIFDAKLEYGSREAAWQKITSEKKSWLLGAFENWILHKKHVWEPGNNPEKMQTINYCLDRLQQFYGQTLETVVKRVLAGKEKLESLLPSPNNPSHESSKHDLEEIIRFCLTETKFTNNQ